MKAESHAINELTPLHAALQAAAQAANDLKLSVDNLHDRLTPVLRPDHVDPEKKPIAEPAPAPSSPFVSDIHSLESHLQAITGDLNNLHQRLEV